MEIIAKKSSCRNVSALGWLSAFGGFIKSKGVSVKGVQ
jgi:hypothetical protein